MENSNNYFGVDLEKKEDIIIENDIIKIENKYKDKLKIPQEEEINFFNPEVIKPKYYVKKNESKLIIYLELSSFQNLKANVQLKECFYLIIITGEEKIKYLSKTEETKKLKKLCNYIETGPIFLTIRIPLNHCFLEKSEPEIKDNIITFNIVDSKKNKKQF